MASKKKTFTKTKAPKDIEYAVWTEYPEEDRYGGRVAAVTVCDAENKNAQCAAFLRNGNSTVFVAELTKKQKVSLPLVFEDA